MKFLFAASCLFLLLVATAQAPAASVSLNQKGPATVWTRTQTIGGTITGTGISAGVLWVNGTAVPFSVSGNSFSSTISLGRGTTWIVAQVDSAGILFSSDTLRFTLGFRPRPEVTARATASGRSVTLRASVVENADSGSLNFEWTARATNPAPVSIAPTADSIAGFTFPQGAPLGEYFFSVLVRSSTGDSTRAGACVVLDTLGARAFDIATEHARWVDSAIIYCVSPYMFVDNMRLTDVTAKLPELKQLGVTTIWIQPLYPTSDPDQGYHVLDYFRVRSQLGTEANLRALVQAAHALGMRVILDFVPNHTGIQHPYAQDAMAKGSASHYYDFYQRTVMAVPYSSVMMPVHAGAMDFVQYFSGAFDPVYCFPMLNVGNVEVQRMLTEAGRYWIEQCDVDGYRLDAVWGINARNPQFAKDWRLALKRVKPDVLLLAEDKATWASVFDERFDVAYDWAAEQSWVSHWPWQVTYTDWSAASKTIFNTTAQAQRSSALRGAITNSNGGGFAPHAKVLRFMENNDLPRFLQDHSLAQTKMAAELLFSLHGVPLLFNGQEVGITSHPYNAVPIYAAGRSIQSADAKGLFPFYQSLTEARKRFPALISDNFAEIPVTPSTFVYAFHRWVGNEHLFTAVNMGASATTAQLNVPVLQLQLDSTRTYYLTDILTGETFSGSSQWMTSATVAMPAYTSRIMKLDTTVVTGIKSNGPSTVELPHEIALLQNYPNPFNPSTRIQFELPAAGHVVLRVYDILGRETCTLVNEYMPAGIHVAEFSAQALASGVYFYRLEAGGRSLIHKMLLLR